MFKVALLLYWNLERNVNQAKQMNSVWWRFIIPMSTNNFYHYSLYKCHFPWLVRRFTYSGQIFLQVRNKSIDQSVRFLIFKWNLLTLQLTNSISFSRFWRRIRREDCQVPGTKFNIIFDSVTFHHHIRCYCIREY